MKALDEVAQLCSHSDLVGVTLMTNFADGAVQITKEYQIEIKYSCHLGWNTSYRAPG